MSFATLGLSDVLFQPLTRLGYDKPTAVQTRAIPLVLNGRDIMARAQTGTGKTAAFGLPMIDRLLVRDPAPRLAASAARTRARADARAGDPGPSSRSSTYGAPVAPARRRHLRRRADATADQSAAARHRHRRGDARPSDRSPAAADRSICSASRS